MDQSTRSAPRTYQFHPARPAITELFNLYLGQRSSRLNADDPSGEPPNKSQKRVTASNRELPPRNEQFILDFEQLQKQFSDQDQLRAVMESVLISLVVQCSSHAPRADFLIFALQSLCQFGHINWDSFLPSLLSSVSSAEMSNAQCGQALVSTSSMSLSQSLVLPSAVTNTVNSQMSNPASPLPSALGVGSPAQSANDMPSFLTSSPVKSDIAYSARVNSSAKCNVISSLRHLSCKIILFGLEFSLNPATHADIFAHMLNWLIYWDQKKQAVEEGEAKFLRPGKGLVEWLHSCLDVIWMLVEEDRCRIPFYELLHSGLQFVDSIPDDEALFTAILEIHRRRDIMAMHMQMLDQHLHCPTFGTHRFLVTTPSTTGETVANLRYSPITYPSVLGEPLHGEVTPFIAF